MSTTFMETEKNKLIKKFHTLLGKLGMNNETKEALLYDNFKVTSSKDLTAHQLLALCNALSLQMNKDDMDAKRKQLIAAIGGWLRSMGMSEGLDKIKAIACRAAECKDFNRISEERLNSLYYAFKKKQRDVRNVEELTTEMLNYLGENN